MVEDEPLIADFVHRGLRVRGHRTVTTDNADHAVAEALTGEGVDLIILDLVLAGDGQGLSVLRAVREQKPWLPVIVVTARFELRDACLEAGATDFIAKPFRFALLASRVDAVLGLGGGERDNG